jgi:hypothetical protein
MLIVKKDINFYGKTKGMDSYEKCYNKQHFKNYKKEIIYQYNSRGFRGAEWPEDLSDVIWCVGDSFTVGIGQPVEEAWPQLLEKKTGKRCLNLGEDGCSNDSIALRIQEIYKLYNPKLIIAMWSFLHRRRVNGKNIHYDDKDFNNEADLKNFLLNFDKTNKLPIKILHTTIPDIFWNEQMLHIANKKTNGKLILYEQLDRARDYLHFDIKTSECISNLIMEKIKDLDKQFKYIL